MVMIMTVVKVNDVIDNASVMRSNILASLGDAKTAVLQSPVWRDKAIEHEAMVDSLLNELDDLGKELDG